MPIDKNKVFEIIEQAGTKATKKKAPPKAEPTEDDELLTLIAEKLTEKKPKQKRVYSDETKAKMVERLRLAREKSLASRKANAKAKQQPPPVPQQPPTVPDEHIRKALTLINMQSNKIKELEARLNPQQKQVQEVIKPQQPKEMPIEKPTKSIADLKPWWHELQ